MSVAIEGYESSAVFTQLHTGLASQAADREAAMKKVKAVFQFDVKNKDGKVQSWTLDLKTKGAVALGAASPKADIIIAVSDADFVNLAAGKANGQQMFMKGKLKIKGNMMLATKLDTVLKGLGAKAKL